jgi:hypothetical protein
MISPLLSKTVGKAFGYGKIDGDFGVELEIEGENLPAGNIQGWRVHVENSLRGKNGRIVQGDENLPDTPREYVTYGAVPFTSLEASLKTLYAKLTKEGTKVDLSPRGSTHFHVNFVNNTFRDIFGFVLAYAIVEPVLIRFCGQHRNGNLFCLPCYETGDVPEFFKKLQPIFDRNTDLRGWPSEGTGASRGKYSALNLDPLTKFGSIEIRVFPNAIEPVLITRWASWLYKIKNLAVSYPAEDYRDFVDSAIVNPFPFTNIFLGENLWQVCAPNNVGTLIEHGVENAYEIYKAMAPILDWKEPEKKKVRNKTASEIAGILGTPDPEVMYYDDFIPLAQEED